MDSDFEKIARDAGFIFWDKDEKQEPTIDWSCDYTEDLENFYNLTLDKSAEIASCVKSAMHRAIEMRINPIETEFELGYLKALDDFIKAIPSYKV